MLDGKNGTNLNTKVFSYSLTLNQPRPEIPWFTYTVIEGFTYTIGSVGIFQI